MERSSLSLLALGLALGACGTSAPEPYFADRVEASQSIYKSDGTCECPSLCSPKPTLGSSCEALPRLETAILSELEMVFPAEHSAECGGAGIFVDPELLGDRAGTFGDFGALNVLAFEWGRHLQRQLGTSGVPGTELALAAQSDCFAGVFAAIQEGKGHLFAEEMMSGGESLCDGDGLWRADDPSTCLERKAAFDTGLQRGRQSMANICLSDPAEVVTFLCGF